MRRIHRLACSMLVAFPVGVLAACSSGGGSGTASGPPPEQSTILVDAVPTADAAGLYIAYDNGYFAQQGLTVKIGTVFGGEFGMADLQSGKAQLLEGNYVSFILAQTDGTYEGKPINMRIVANTSQMQPGNQALYVMPGSKFKTVADLTRHHARIGINSPHNIGQVLLGSLFKENGLSMSGIQQVYNQLPLLPQLLSSGKIDAAWLPEPFGTEAEQQYGAVQLADFDTGSLQNFPIGSVVGTTQWIKTHPNTVAAFLRAFQQGQQVADTNRHAVEQALLRNKVAATQVIAATMTLDTYPLTMDVPAMQRVSDAMYEFGLMPVTFKQAYQITEMIQPEPGEILK
jgi:NitT/TauT family transport system substrate-binding protein